MTNAKITKNSTSSEGSIKEILTVAFPLIIASATHTVLTFTDRMFLSWYSADCIAASGPASILSYSFICFFIGTGTYLNTIIAQYSGAKKRFYITKALWQGIYFGLLSSAAIVMLIPAGNMFIAHSEHGKQVIILEKSYFSLLMYGGGLAVMGSVFSSFFSGRGRTRPVMIITLISTTINILLDYILIFGKFGFPALGIVGAGIATLLSHSIALILFASFFFQYNCCYRF